MSPGPAVHTPLHIAVGGPHPVPAGSGAYLCPGEAHPISQSVHYARLAAYFPNCRECVHRHDAGHLPQPIVEHRQHAGRRSTRGAPTADESIRGVYLNELTRPLAERYAAAFAELLWERHPLRARISRRTPADSRARGPAVVIAQDDRPAAPDLLVGAAASLRRMGCQVIDVGQVSTPCFWSAVDHLRADGGMHVTGQGRGPAGIGFDFVEAGGIPWSRNGSLDRLEHLVTQPTRRTSRNGGSLRSFRVRVPYEAGLLKHFQSLRPLHVGVACLASTVAPLLDELLTEIPCRLQRTVTPVADDARAVSELAAGRLAEQVREGGQQAGVLLGDDGQSCKLLDERGIPVPTAALALRLGERALREAPSKTIVLDDALATDLDDAFAQLGGSVVRIRGSRENMARSMASGDAVFGCDAADRFWFKDATPHCDALITLAKILHWLSNDSQSLSALRNARSEAA